MSDAQPNEHVRPDPGGDSTSSTRGPGPGRLTFIILGVCVLLAGAFAVFAARYRADHNQLTSIRVTGIPASVPTSLANLMALSPVPARPAPAFTLTDQHGHTRTLASFRGRAVVLEFMDSHCVDICPLVSQEYVHAYQDLGKAASHVVFVAVNVNPFNVSVSDVAAFSTAHQLNTIPSWHFFTGSRSELKSVWRRYGIEVDAPSVTTEVIHTSIVLFVDPQGLERYIATPMDDHTSRGRAYLPADQLASWGQGIALVSRSLTG